MVSFSSLLLTSLIKIIFPCCTTGNLKFCFIVESMNIPLKIAQHPLSPQLNSIHTCQQCPAIVKSKERHRIRIIGVGVWLHLFNSLEILALRDNKKILASFSLADFLINDSYFLITYTLPLVQEAPISHKEPTTKFDTDRC